MVIIGRVVLKPYPLPWLDVVDEEGRSVLAIELERLEGKRVIVSIRELVEAVEP